MFNKEGIHKFTRVLVSKGFNWEWDQPKAVDSDHIIIWKPKQTSRNVIFLNDILDGTLTPDMFT